ncbi:MAG: hypothetical protein JWL89_386 [Candidatus Saccharibacteria bacterium]|nr:hypothetical protein [Candidatus Saccharibacteria bacterium]
MANTIVCTNCGVSIEVDKALEGQIEARVLAAEQHKHSEELAKVRAEAEAAAKKEKDAVAERVRRQLEGEKELLKQQAEADLELVKKKLELEASSQQKKTAAEQESLVRTLKDDAESAKLDSKKLREELTDMMKLLREEKQARANAELEAQKKLAAGEDKIREEALKNADEKHHLRQLEMEKQLADTKKALEDAQRKATQGSQQNQGEVLELDLENRLREEFPFDEITEVKKGQRGADMKQIVRNQSGTNCGLLLWETKNGKWQPAWIPKFKADIREANASIGVIVSQEIPSELGEMKHLEGNVWVVTPKLAPRLAAALRITILQVDTANKMNAGKDAKMESLYQFLVGPEFRHRVEAIVENYTVLQDEIEREKRASALKWARQEKAIRAVIDNTIGMYGDLQGITNRALPAIKTLELDSGELEEAELPSESISTEEDDTAQPTLL